MVHALQDYGLIVDVHDPRADVEATRHQHELDLCGDPVRSAYDGIILAVPHAVFRAMPPEEMRTYGKPVHVFYDIKSAFPADRSDLRL